LENLGGTWQDRVYLSCDRNISPDDLLLDTRDHTEELNAGASYIDTYDGIAPAVTGPRYLLVRTTATDGFVDPDLVNNVAASARPLGIDVPTVEVGASISGTVWAGEWRYICLNATEGNTIVVSLAGTSGLKLYASRGELPTLDDYDFVSDSDQELRILTPVDDTYYIGVYAPASPSGSHDFTVSAANTSLTIRRVTPNLVGNTGTATIEIIGDNFDLDAQAQLIASSGVVIEADEYWQDASTVYATFDLASVNAEHGQYDLKIVNTDAFEATELDAVTVEPGEAPEFQAELHMPGISRPGRTVTVSIEYTNQSSQDVAAPLLRLTANDEVMWDLPGLEDTLRADICYVMALSSTGPANILRPGQTETIDLSVHVPLTGSQLSIDLDSLVPDVSSGSDYSVAWGWTGPNAEEAGQELRDDIGETWGEYVRTLGEVAEAIMPYQGLVYSAGELSSLAELWATQTDTDDGSELQQDGLLLLEVPTLLIWHDDQWHQWHSADEADETGNPLFNTSLDSVLLIHGHADSMGNTAWENMARALSHSDNVNILGFDWSCHSSSSSLPWFTSRYIPVDAAICSKKLNDLGISTSRLHVIGHSHGAHLAGLVCEDLQNNNCETPKRLTALDASPEHTHELGGWSAERLFTGDTEWILDFIRGWKWTRTANFVGQGWGAFKGSATFIEFYKSSEGCSGTTLWGHDNFLIVHDEDVWGDSYSYADDNFFGQYEHSVSVNWFTQTILSQSRELGYWWTEDKWDYDILADLPGNQIVYPWRGIIRGTDTIECVL